MRLEHYPIDRLKKEILEIIGKHLDLSKYKVFFFGSRVSGKGDDRSDIDVGIEGPDPIPGSTLSLITEEVENIRTLYTIEIVDFKKVSDNFYNVAKQNIKMIN